MSTLRMQFTGLLGFYFDPNQPLFKVGVLDGTPGHNLEILKLTYTANGDLEEEPLAASNQSRILSLSIVGAPTLTEDPDNRLVPVDFLRPFRHQQGAFAPTLELRHGVLRTRTLHEVAEIGPPPHKTRCRRRVTFCAEVQIEIPQGATFHYGNESTEMLPVPDTNYALLVSNQPAAFLDPTSSHFHHYYDRAFRAVPAPQRRTVDSVQPGDPVCDPLQFQIAPPQAVSPSFPCVPIGLGNPPD